jgi:hypothetical protein
MACKFCNSLKLKKLKKLDKEIRLGKKSAVQLASEYNTSTKRIRKHIDRCLSNDDVSGHQVLKELLETVKKDLKSARSDALYGDEDESRGAAILYTALLREARELVSSIDKTKPNQQLSREIQSGAILPFVTAMSKIVNEEGGKLQTELQTLLGEYFDKNCNKALVDAFTRMAQRLDVEYKLVDGRVSEVLNGKPSKSGKKNPAEGQLH